ncbi:hypothetical protein EVD33_04475 [Bacteroidales bacterium SW292]|nr:hypothetical protein [Bacteroidales bacterium SW292]
MELKLYKDTNEEPSFTVHESATVCVSPIKNEECVRVLPMEQALKNGISLEASRDFLMERMHKG